jgi:Universal stress protein family
MGEIVVGYDGSDCSRAALGEGSSRVARMIVVGSYGEAPLKGAIIGSTPYKLLHLSQRPVLVVPAGG